MSAPLRVFFVLAFLLSGCDEPSGSGTTQTVSTAGVVRGEVRYAGASKGPLRIAVFTSFPPRGAPVAIKEIAEPRYPQSYEVKGVPSGRYFVLAIVDTDKADGERFRPSIDPGGAFGGYQAPISLEVDSADGAPAVDIELLDPQPGSPWSRPGYR